MPLSRASINRYTPIGIEPDPREFRCVQFDRATGALHAAAAIPRRSNDAIPARDELDRLVDTVWRRGFESTNIAITPPSGSSSFHILDLPPEESGAPIAQLARAEILRSGAHKTEAIEIGYWAIEGKKGTTTRYAHSSESDRIDELADAFEHAGFVVGRVIPAGSALQRAAIESAELEEGAIHCITDIGWHRSIIVVSIGQTPVYTRRVARGASHAIDHLLAKHPAAEPVVDRLLEPLSADNPLAPALRPAIASMITPVTEQLDTALTYVSQIHRFAPFGTALVSGYLATHPAVLDAVTNRTAMRAAALTCAEPADPHSPVSPAPYEIAKLALAAGLALGDE
jgi:Tfp pilus assembly PilM family ATPase